MTGKPTHRTIIMSILLVMMLAVSFTLSGAAQRGYTQDLAQSTRTITVTGTGTSNGVPDTVYIGFGVDRVDSNIEDTVTGARTTLREIVAAVRGTGVEERDIQTAYYNVFPEDRFDNMGQSTGQRQFRVSLGINVVVRDVDNATPVISAALNAGANSIQNLNFGIANTRSLESQARTAAIADARARAEELATALGVTLGEVVTVVENYGGGPIPLPQGRADIGMGGNNQIVPGQLTVSTFVQVTFSIAS